MDRIKSELIWLFGPCFADGFVGCEAFEGLQSACEIVGGDEVLQVGAQLLVGLVVEAFDGRLFDRAVHALDLAVGPRMPGLGQAMVNVVLGTGMLERMSIGVPAYFNIAAWIPGVRPGQWTERAI